ncbi:MAG: HDIG domain-containing protein [Desulfobacterales bacterium]|nr:HDIG domain-containing protein [Desulfobacterales bacterium]
MRNDPPSNRVIRLLLQPTNLRWIILLACVLVFCTILYPGLADTKLNYQIGDVAQRNFKASRDFLIEDRGATETNRADAAAAVLTVYDHDAELARRTSATINQAFAEMRKILAEAHETLAPPPLSEESARLASADVTTTAAPAVSLPSPTPPAPQLSIEQIMADKRQGFEERLGAKTDKETYGFLIESGFAPALAQRIIHILAEILKSGIATNKDILLKEGERGIVLREVASGQEQIVRNLRQFYGLEEAQTMVRIIGQPMLKDLGYSDYQLIVDMVQDLLRPNITLNRNATNKRREEAIEAVKPVFHKIKAGEMLLREGERVSAVHLLKLRALEEEQRGQRIALSSLGAALILIGLMVAAYRVHYARMAWSDQAAIRNLIFIAALFCTFFIVAELTASLARPLAQNTPFAFKANSIHYLAPMAAAPMLACIFLGLEVALPIAAILAVAAAIIFQGTLAAFVFFFVNGSLAAFWIRHCRERKVFLKASMQIGLLNVALVTALAVYSGRFSLPTLAWEWAFGFFGGIGVGIVASGLVPLAEIVFGYSSDIKMLELANLDQPLMRQLMIEAPGTYHHSVIVGSLVEAAASEIGANPLLAKVCGYYHDIGKINKPDYFIENQPGRRNRHDRLAPSMSALILIAHIKDGIDLARRHKLGPVITDTIQQHHGTSLIRYFYEKARQRAGEAAVNMADFRYPGPKPQTREAGLVMLADAVEAASRTLDNPTPSRIQGLVQKLINGIFSDGQLDNCELTLRDLHKIAKSFNTILNGIHHHRIEYPETNGRTIDRGRHRNGSPDQQSTRQTIDFREEDPEDGTGHLRRLGIS